MSFSRLFLCIIIIILIFPLLVFAQDSVRVIILSDKVGPVIDPSEKETYQILQAFDKKFISAFFFETKDGSAIFCRVTLKENGKERDTTFVRSAASIKNTALLIETHDSKEKTLPGEINLRYIDTLIQDFSHTQSLNVDSTSRRTGQKIVYINERSRELPLVNYNPGAVDLITRQWKFFIGIGGAFRTSGLRDLNKIYNLFERELPDSGYSLGISKSDYRLPLMFNFSSLLIFRDMVFSEMTLSTINSDEITAYRSFRFSLGYMYKLSRVFSPFAEAGYTGVYFKAKRSYGKVVSSIFPSLEYIEIEGKTYGFDLRGGFIIDLGENVILNVNAGYKFLKTVRLTGSWQMEVDPSWDTSVNANGPDISITFMIN